MDEVGKLGLPEGRPRSSSLNLLHFGGVLQCGPAEGWTQEKKVLKNNDLLGKKCPVTVPSLGAFYHDRHPELGGLSPSFLETHNLTPGSCAGHGVLQSCDYSA